MILGIDPGASGCACILGGEEPIFIRFSKFTTIEIIEKIKEYDYQLCLLEKVSSMPGQGVSSTFKFGKNYGWITGVVETLNIPLQLKRPQDWQKGLGIPKEKNKTKHKQNLKQAAQRLCPSVKFTNDMADAYLIAKFAENGMKW